MRSERPHAIRTAERPLRKIRTENLLQTGDFRRPTFTIEDVPPEDSLATSLKARRLAGGFSLRGLAERAGVSKSALGAWEAGINEPSLPELDAVLGVYGASPDERRAILARMTAPRARRELRRSPGREDAPETVAWTLVALRLRRGLSPEGMASRLGVDPATVWRWERGDIVPTPARCEAILLALDAPENEREALLRATGGPPREGRPPLDLAAAEALLDDANWGALESDPFPALRALGLVADLWPLASASPRAERLYRVACARLAGLMTAGYGCYEAATPFAHRALAGGAHLSPRLTVWSVQAIAQGLAERGGEEGTEAARAFLREWTPRLEGDAHCANWCRRTVAWFTSDLGDHDAALRLSSEACRRERAIGADVPNADFDHARLLLRMGRADEALALLPGERDEAPLQMALDAVAWADAFLTTGDLDGAERAYARARAFAGVHTLPGVRRSLVRIGRRLDERL